MPVSTAASAAVPAGSTTRPRLNNTATVALISSSLTNMIPLTNFRIWLKAFLPAKGGASPEAILWAPGHCTAHPLYNNHNACWLGSTEFCKIITLINFYPDQPILIVTLIDWNIPFAVSGSTPYTCVCPEVFMCI